MAKQLELYRAMKTGNIAPDIAFNGDVFKNGSVIKMPSRLSEIQSAYKVVILEQAGVQNVQFIEAS